MTTTLTRTLTVAAGVFAPGHLGELTRYLPFELVDDVLAQTGTLQQRLRALPSRTGVYFVLALGLFPRIGYARVWAKLCAGLTGAGMVVPAVSEKALRELRRRLGAAPFKALFEVVAGPLAQPRTPGVCFAGMRTVAFDGLNSLKIPDTERNRCWIGRIWYRLAFAGYPTLRLMCLVETGTRGLLGAVIGGAIGTPGDRDEAHLARQLLRLLGPGMLVLADRAFDSAPFLAEVDRTGAKLLVRAGCARKPAVLRHLPDGSYLSQLGGLPVRIIEAEITVRGADGTTMGDHYRLITTLLDDRRFPAARLIRLYHERWEIETAYLALRHTMLAGHVLRSGDRAGVEQEVWALLTLYQLLRTAMVEAIETRPDLDPDRASFTTALHAARDQLVTAEGIDPDPATAVDQLGVIGQAVLATLLPARRLRYSNRNIKCPTSRYHARDDGRPALSTGIVAIDIAVHTPPPHTTPPAEALHPFRHRLPAPSQPSTLPVPTRRQLVTATLLSQPSRDWHGCELANKLKVKQATRRVVWRYRWHAIRTVRSGELAGVHYRCTRTADHGPRSPRMSQGPDPEPDRRAGSASTAGRSSLAGLSPSRLREWLPGIFAARLLHGVTLPSGRIVGETDRVVHLFPIPTGRRIPDELRAFCGLALRPGQAELVTVGTGMPCAACVITAPDPETP